MCVNDGVAMLSSSAKTSACLKLTAKQECSYQVGNSNIKTIYEYKQTVMDIEELVAFSKLKKACPFYLSSDAVKSGEPHIVFLPYNYLLDSQQRHAQKLDLRNAIIVFDEGHNVESQCTEAASFDLSVGTIAGACKELDKAFDLLAAGNRAAAEDVGSRVQPGDITKLKHNLENLVKLVRSVALSKSAPREATYSGSYIFQLLADAGFQETAWTATILCVNSCVKLLSRSNHKSTHGRFHLVELASAFSILFNGPLCYDQSLIRHYRVHIDEKEVYQTTGFVNERTLSFWCFSAEVAMKELVGVEGGVRAVILASGTLAPLDSFGTEFGIPFPLSNRIENTHVIDQCQIFVAANTHGPGLTELQSTYLKRDDKSYIKDLGQSIVNICKAVPDGVLCFFTSYALLDKYLASWKIRDSRASKSIWSSIQDSKQIFFEPKSKQDFAEAFASFEKAIKDNCGAIFFAVCKGKASEGIDFSDNKARAVILCGIPFTNKNDTRTALKMKCIDGGRTLSEGGNQWYVQQAYRALNQAIGRVVRHRRDYGAIILLDSRFAMQSHKSNLPVWVRPYVMDYNNQFGVMYQDLLRFFKFHKEGAKDRSLLKIKKSAPKIAYEDPHQVRFVSNRGHDPLAEIGRRAPQPLLPLNLPKEGVSTKINDSLQLKRNPRPADPLQVASVTASVSDAKKPKPEPTEEKKAREKLKLEAAARFKAGLKKTLSAADNELFNSRIVSYSLNRYTQVQLIDKLARLLFTAGLPPEEYTKRYQLFCDFGFFISQRNDSYFQTQKNALRPRA
ncbi:hypothetical protein HDU91_004732 [Kappamyces sp. JEL0680]|nr:hypothetical protein HDU91_004732 [Kappamyces sp. JEL0680]